MKYFGFMEMCVQGIPGIAVPHLTMEHSGAKSIDIALPGTYPPRTHPIVVQVLSNPGLRASETEGPSNSLRLDRIGSIHAHWELAV